MFRAVSWIAVLAFCITVWVLLGWHAFAIGFGFLVLVGILARYMK